MKKVLTLLLAALFVCMVMPMQGAFAETVEEKLATDQSLWEMYRLNNPEGAVQIEYGANTMALKRAGATYAMQYKKEQTDAIYKFKVKFENPVTPFGDENFVDFCIRDTAPGSACWHNNDNCYALRLRSIPGTSELKAHFSRNNSGSNNTPIGQIYDLTGANALEFGRYYEFEIGVVNNQDGNVELTFSIDGVQILKTVDDSDNKITGAGYFTIYSAAKTDVVIYTASAPSPAEPVIELISDIGTVTPASENSIAAAQAAYDALSEDDKLLVTNADVLAAAVAKFDSFRPTFRGVSIRTSAPWGLRFGTDFSNNAADGTGYSIVKYGTVVLSQQKYVSGELKVGTANALNSEGDILSEADVSTFGVTIINIPSEHYDTKVMARTYIVYENDVTKEQVTVYNAEGAGDSGDSKAFVCSTQEVADYFNIELD